MTIGLCIIIPRVTPELDALLETIKPYFDKFYIQVNAPGSEKYATPDKDRFREVSYYKWNDNFADARNALHKEIKTDYWVWMDDDDNIEGLQNLKDIVRHMAKTETDVMFAPYHYEIKNGETVILQGRERIIKTSVPGKWMGRIHETFVPDVPVKMDRTGDIQWVHDKTESEYKASKARNLKVLEEECAKPEPDPRDLHYLALAYLGDERWAEAVETGLKYIKVGGWDEEIYRTWLLIAKCELELEQPEKAIAAALAGTRLLPAYPDAYFYLQDIYYQMGNYGHSLEWWKVARSKPLPETNSPIDPTVAAWRGTFSAAMAYSMLGKVHEAYKLMTQVKKLAPESREVKEWFPDIEAMYEEAVQIENLEDFAEYFSKHGGDTELLYKSLPPSIQSYPQISMMMKQYLKPVEWPTKSIVFFCGPALEPWGPDTLDKGMGGSEEAVTYLSRELIKLGWQIAVYNERTEVFNDNGVVYLPWQDFNPNDSFDVLVGWRSPSILSNPSLKARLKCADLHDMPYHELNDKVVNMVDKFFFKSQFHRQQFPQVPDSKALVISNGIVKEQFKQVTQHV